MERSHAVMMLLIMIAALALRLGVVAAIPSFFGSGDPSVYYGAARGCLRYGVPQVDFIWQFATSPPAIAHLEDYIEPAFAYLLALPMVVMGGGIVAAKLLSVICGTLAVLLVYLLSRRFGDPVAILAAALVAFEPWSIYYSGLIMKEAAVSVIVLLFFAAACRLLAAAHNRRSVGFRFGLLTVAAGCFQYELLPILASATAGALWIHQRRLVWPYVAGTAAAGLVLLAITWGLMGVPISAKLYYFTGRDFWDPLPTATSPDWARLVLKFLPVKFAVSGLAGWYPVLLVLALLGTRNARVHRAESTLLAAFGLSYLYFHAVPGNLWPRFLIPATAVFASYAALGIAAIHGWLTRAWSPAVAGALLAFALVAPRAYTLAARLVPGATAASHWAAAAIVVAGVALPAVALYAARNRVAVARVRPLLPALLVIAVALNYHASLSWPAIYGNPQMPGYERIRAQRERVCRQVRGIIAGEPVMATAPGEVSLYAGAPSVLLPDSPLGIRAVQARYRTPYLLARAGVLRPGVIEHVPVEPVLEVEDYTLYQFIAEGRPARTSPAQ